MVGFLIIALQLVLLALMLAMIVSQVVAVTSVPWVRTPRWKTRRILEFGGLKKGERLVDFGCGDGSAVIDAARDFDAMGTGIETQFSLVSAAKLRAWMLGIRDRVRFIYGSMFKVPPPPADLVFCYLYPEFNAQLEPILKNAYPSGTRVVSRTFRFPTLPLVASEQLGAETVYLYRIP
jgi:hypothetical protein